MTSQGDSYTEEEQQVFDYFVYDGKASEVGSGLSAWGYLRLLEDGFPDDPDSIELFLVGEWENEYEAMKGFPTLHKGSETHFTKCWLEMQRSENIVVRELENGRVVVYIPFE